MILIKQVALFSGTTGILEGFVRNKATDKPLLGANVMVLQTRQGTATAATGCFRVSNLPAGTTSEGNIRDGKTREVAYLVDGLAVQDLVRGGLGIELPKSAIEQLNIKTGGFDAEYGNALSGVVNVITRRGGNVPVYFVRADADHLFAGKQNSKASEAEFFVAGPIRRDRLHYFWRNMSPILMPWHRDLNWPLAANAAIGSQERFLTT